MSTKSVYLEGQESFDATLAGTEDLTQKKLGIFGQALKKIFPRYAAILAADFPVPKIDIARQTEGAGDFSEEKAKLLTLIVKAGEKGGRLPY